MGFVFVTACSSKPQRHSLESATFATQITQDGSKRFSVSIESNERLRNSRRENAGERGRGGPNGGERRSGRGNRLEGQRRPNRSDNIEDMRQRMIEVVQAKLSETEFCREGYLELDYTEINATAKFVGECLESATDEDRVRQL